MSLHRYLDSLVGAFRQESQRIYAAVAEVVGLVLAHLHKSSLDDDEKSFEAEIVKELKGAVRKDLKRNFFIIALYRIHLHFPEIAFM